MKNAWKSWGVGAALIVVLTVTVYIPAMRGGFIWDDDGHVSQLQALRTVQGLLDIWRPPGATPQYYPLTFTTFWVEYHLWGINPFGYHLINILLHALNAVLLWRVLRNLKVAGAWWVAAIFAVHPVAVESVAWIAERKNTLSAAFYLTTILAYFRFRDLKGDGTARAWNWRFYPVVLLLFLFALLSKTVTCSLPVVLALLVWWKRGLLAKRDVVALIPMLLLGLGLGLMTASMEKQRVGAMGEEWALSFVDRCLIAGRALWFYAGKVLWPYKLMFVYFRWEIDAGVWWQNLFPIAALLVPITLWLMRHRFGRGPLVAVLFFAVTLAPALGFIDVFPFLYSFVADHFQYLASIGVIALAVTVVVAMVERGGDRGRWIGTLAGAIVLTALGVWTWNQGHIYKDQEALWRDTVARNPTAWMAHHNLGSVLANQGRIVEAIAEYQAALKVVADLVGTGPDSANAVRKAHESAVWRSSETRHTLADALASQGRVAEAIAEYQAALRINPRLAKAYHHLGLVFASQGRIPEAIAEYAAALQIDPGIAQAYHDLGDALTQQGQTKDATDAYLSALQINPNLAQTHHNLGSLLARQDRIAEAIDEYRRALRINPNFAETHHNLGLALASQGKTTEAITEYEAVLRINPNFAETHHNLGLALASQGKTTEAIAEYEAALRIRPAYPATCYDLAEALAAEGKAQEAIAEYRKACHLKPEWPLPLGKLAWILATHPSADIRNGTEAVRLARLLCVMTGNVQPHAFDVLAAAFAEMGQFNDAVATARKAVELARSAGQPEIAEEIESRLKLYRERSAYRQPSPITSPSQP